MYIVSIEWDGKKGSGTYYARLKSFGIKVRGTKDEEPAERRKFVSSARFVESESGQVRISYRDGVSEVEIKGTVVQEGSVLTQSESFARYLAFLAHFYGARQVMIGTVELTEFQQTSDDTQTFTRIQNAMGRRGRVSADTLSDWVITCHECVNSHQIENQRDWINCPKCNATNVTARPGRMHVVNPPDGTLRERWHTTRLFMGSFEVPIFDLTKPKLPVLDMASMSEREQKVIESIEKSSITSVLENDKMMDEKDKMLILDSLFSSLTYHNESSRNNARVDACIHLYKSGVPPTKVPVRLPTGQVDILDVAAVLGVNQAIRYFYKLGLNQ